MMDHLYREDDTAVFDFSVGVPTVFKLSKGYTSILFKKVVVKIKLVI